MRRYRYVLPLDIRQFFPSIDHAILLDVLAKTILDEKVLHLCKTIVDSGQGVLKEEYDMVFFTADTLFDAVRPRGLPIGNLTSQFWANVYLNDLDHFIKRQLKCPAYVRYVDDMLLFSNQKEELHQWRTSVMTFLASLRLTVHENSAQPRPTACGVPFLGFQVFRDHRRVKSRKVVHAHRRLMALAQQYNDGEIPAARLRDSVQGWINHVRYGDTWGLRRALLRETGLCHDSGGEIGARTVTHL
jgi:hypothetical protein